MSRLSFDLSQDGMMCIFRPYQAESMRHFWDVKRPLTSREVHAHLQGRGGEVALSRASVINFLNDMVDEGFLDYVEESGKGGYHRVYSVNDKSRTEQVFRKAIWLMFHEKLNTFSTGEART